VKPNGKILWAVTDVIELFKNQLNLLSQLSSAWLRSKFNSFDKRAPELLVQLLSCFNFKNIISQSYQVSDSGHLKMLGALKECP
jgi:hypothetical protein